MFYLLIDIKVSNGAAQLLEDLEDFWKISGKVA